MNATPETFRPAPAVEATIEQIRYWVPTIKDVAQVYEGADGGSWLLSIEPSLMSACPVALDIKSDGDFDIAIAGETYEQRHISQLAQFVRLLERISEGFIIQRRWYSAVTGAHHGVETIVTLEPGLHWRGGAEADVSRSFRDRHFLPYRRRA